MPAIGEMSYGYDSAGVDLYLEEIKAIVLTEAATAIEDTSTIKTAVEANWIGHAQTNFLENLDRDAKHVSTQLTELYNGLTTEINNVKSAMTNFDQNLIQNN